MTSPQSDPATGEGKEKEPFSASRRASQSPARVYQPGDIIAQKYRLTRLLGEGGMGAVWLARNEKLEVDVAIKLIRYEHATADTSYRLLQEARAAARIGHRSIVRVFDFGETELDDPFIVMEMLTGESLRDLLERKGRLPAAQAARTLLPIASALVEAHASGIVHRDLKPENVMLVPDASGGLVPKLLDFGIAHFRRTEGEVVENAGQRLVAGTLEYMSPEQMGPHDPVDGGADVWSLAVMLYEAITGEMPFAGSSPAALVFAIMTEEPKCAEGLAPDDPLWLLLKAALAKQCSTRPTIRAFGRALAEWTIGQGIDSDVAGNSLAAHWLNENPTHPFSVLPPPVSSQDGGVLEIAVPKPAPLPRGMTATIQPSATRDEARRRGRVAVAVATMAAAAAISLVGFGRTIRRRAAPPPETVQATAHPTFASSVPSSEPASAASASATATATPADDTVPHTPSSAATPEGSAKASLASSAPTLEPVAPVLSAVGTLPPGARGGRPASTRRPRRSTLPIAKQPNF